MAAVIQIVIIVLAPLLWTKLLSGRKIEAVLSPIVMAYLTGILLANLDIFPIDTELSTTFSHAAILFAIPLLIYSTDFRKWIKSTKGILLSFALIILAGLASTTINAFLFKDTIANSWMVSGMLAGVYSGGTPNMQAIGIALNAGEEIYILLNAADIFCSGIYLLVLTSFAHALLGRFLPSFKKVEKSTITKIEDSIQNDFGIKEIGQAFFLTLVIVGVAVGITLLLTGALENSSIIILLITTFSIGISFVPWVNKLNGTFEMGEYALLIFCVAIGMLTDFGALLDQGGSIIYFTGSVLAMTIVLHYLLCWLFKIDRDTAMITSTAAVYGPVFIGQIASTIKNRDLVLPGIATGLVGIALGNYMGLAIAYLLKYFMS